jgi:hypothetical protein
MMVRMMPVEKEAMVLRRSITVNFLVVTEVDV